MIRLAILAFALTASAANAQVRPPTKVGACLEGTIKSIGTRFGDKLVQPKSKAEDNGSAFEATNGVYGIVYWFVPELASSRVGDRVRSCLVSVPRGCPKGDDRGRVYTTTNVRTGASWTMSDAQHMCGGA